MKATAEDKVQLQNQDPENPRKEDERNNILADQCRSVRKSDSASGPGVMFLDITGVMIVKSHSQSELWRDLGLPILDDAIRAGTGTRPYLSPVDLVAFL